MQFLDKFAPILCESEYLFHIILSLDTIKWGIVSLCSGVGTEKCQRVIVDMGQLLQLLRVCPKCNARNGECNAKTNFHNFPKIAKISRSRNKSSDHAALAKHKVANLSSQ